MASVQQEGFSLKYASENIQSDKEVVMAAVKQYGYSLRHASENLRNDVMFLGELWYYGEESVQKYICVHSSPEIKSELKKDPLYLANFSPSQVKPTK